MKRMQMLMPALIVSATMLAADVKTNLEKAFKNPQLKERAARDIEFAGYEF